MWDAPAGLAPEDVKGMALTQTEDGKVGLRGLDRNDWPNKWLFGPEFGYALVRYRACLPKSNTRFVENVMEDFKPVDGLMLPFRIRGAMGQDPSHPRRTETLRLKACYLNDPSNTPDR